MKVKHILSLVMAVVFVSCAQKQVSPYGTAYHWDKGTIVVETPERPAGQEHVLGLTAPKLETVRVGFVGLGMRGPWAVMRFAHIPGVEIVALCDYEEGRAEACQKYLRDTGLMPADSGNMFVFLRSKHRASPLVGYVERKVNEAHTEISGNFSLGEDTDSN